MKLSEMNSNQLADALCDIVEPVTAIMGDSAMLDLFREGADLKGADANLFLVRKVLPAVLKNHRHDLFAVLSALTGKPVAEIEKQNGMQTIKELRDSFDTELLDFFGQARG